MWEHAAWADRLLLGALLRLDPCPAAVWREYAHVLGAESIWLDRLLRRPARFAVWPTLEPAAAAAKVMNPFRTGRIREGKRPAESRRSIAGSAVSRFGGNRGAAVVIGRLLAS
jgi:hypothetical protein